MVKADQDDEPSLELASVGAYGAFVVTNCWEHCSKEKEITQISPEEYEKRGSPGAKEMDTMFCFYALKPDRNVDLTMKLSPKARTFHQRVAGKKVAVGPSPPSSSTRASAASSGNWPR